MDAFNSGGGTISKLSTMDSVTMVVAGRNFDELVIQQAYDIYEIPAVTDQWILISSKLGKLASMKAHEPIKAGKLFQNCIFTMTLIDSVDRRKLFAMITFHGGTVQKQFDNKVTHLLSGGSQAVALKLAYSLNKSNLTIVTPDWVQQCLKSKRLVDPEIFHPSLLLSPMKQTSNVVKLNPKDSSVPLIRSQLQQNTRPTRPMVMQHTPQQINEILQSQIQQEQAKRLASQGIQPPSTTSNTSLLAPIPESLQPSSQQSQNVMSNVSSQNTITNAAPPQVNPVQNNQSSVAQMSQTNSNLGNLNQQINSGAIQSNQMNINNHQQQRQLLLQQMEANTRNQKIQLISQQLQQSTNQYQPIQKTFPGNQMNQTQVNSPNIPVQNPQQQQQQQQFSGIPQQQQINQSGASQQQQANPSYGNQQMKQVISTNPQQGQQIILNQNQASSPSISKQGAQTGQLTIQQQQPQQQSGNAGGNGNFIQIIQQGQNIIQIQQHPDGTTTQHQKPLNQSIQVSVKLVLLQNI